MQSIFILIVITGCSYCEKVKELLQSDNPSIINCDEYLANDKEGFLSWVELQTGGIKHRTFPMVFHEGKFIGGFTETKTARDLKNACSGNLDF